MLLIDGAILAGGFSRRMNGEMKGLLPVGKHSMLERITERMNVICSNVTIIVGTAEQADAVEGLSVTQVQLDPIPDEGPLAAIRSVFEYTEHGRAVWVSACDMPFVSEIAAVHMLDKLHQSECMAVVPEIDGRLHPLQAVYRAECGEAATSCLEAGHRGMKHLLNHIPYVTINERELLALGLDSRFTVNVNTRQQYEEALQMEAISGASFGYLSNRRL